MDASRHVYEWVGALARHLAQYLVSKKKVVGNTHSFRLRALRSLGQVRGDLARFPTGVLSYTTPWQLSPGGKLPPPSVRA